MNWSWKNIAALTTALLATAPAAWARPSPAVVAFWERLHRCEQPSTWHHPGPTYPGGLGIYAPNWRWWAGELRLTGRYPTAATAPRLVQIRVAEYGYRRYRGYWGCFATVGRPPREHG